ncbi:MAG: hypothetical protein ABIR79_10955 [Candidatus Binatia bacterium]
MSDASVVLGNNDLRLTTAFRVGTRFAAVGIPQGATIQRAYVQFSAAQADTALTDITIRIQSADDAQPFTATNNDLGSGRTYESAPLVVTWAAIPAWTSGAAGDAQKAAGLEPLIQAVVNRANWTEASALVLRFDATTGGRTAKSFDGSAAAAPVLIVTYFDPKADVVAALPVCLPAELNPNLSNVPDPDSDGGDDDHLPDGLATDCANRVENTYKGLIDACGYFSNPGTNCNCEVVPTNFHDLNKDGAQDPGEEYYGFVRETCDHQPTVCEEQVVNLPADPNDPARCNNFDPVQLADCVGAALQQCANIGTPAHECDTDGCLTYVAATNAPNGDPVCIAHASVAPPAIAFQLFGRRSTCDLTGTSEIKVGDDAREPEHDPLTRGTVEIIGGPCPGGSCVVGISTQLAPNPITFEVKWHSDPTFSKLIQAGNSGLTAATVDSLGVATLPTNSTTGVGRGQRGSNEPLAFEGGNEAPLDLTADWAGFTCALNGNLSSDADTEDPDGLCDDGTTVCHADSPECDGIGGGTCTFATGSSDPVVVNVALSGVLVNQPPTANAGGDQTVECTSPAGAHFVLDGTASSDPDGTADIRVVSWRQGHRMGPEVGFDRTLPVALGVGQSRSYVLRVFDAFSQMDEDTVTTGVVDTTPPVVSCNAPATISPPNKPIPYTATATDVCTASVTPSIVSYECFKLNANGTKTDKTKTCKVAVNGATITISPPQGVGEHIAWTARAVDGSGNVGTTSCAIEVVRK